MLLNQIPDDSVVGIKRYWPLYRVRGAAASYMSYMVAQVEQACVAYDMGRFLGVKSSTVVSCSLNC